MFRAGVGAALTVTAMLAAPPVGAFREVHAQERAPRAWSQPPRPTSRDYPRAALHQNISGWADIRCTLINSPTPSACVIENEIPVGHGFGEAAMRVVSRARLNTAAIRPEKIGTTYVVRVPFQA